MKSSCSVCFHTHIPEKKFLFFFMFTEIFNCCLFVDLRRLVGVLAYWWILAQIFVTSFPYGNWVFCCRHCISELKVYRCWIFYFSHGEWIRPVAQSQVYNNAIDCRFASHYKQYVTPVSRIANTIRDRFQYWLIWWQKCVGISKWLFQSNVWSCD